MIRAGATQNLFEIEFPALARIEFADADLDLRP